MFLEISLRWHRIRREKRKRNNFKMSSWRDAGESQNGRKRKLVCDAEQDVPYLRMKSLVSMFLPFR